LCSLLLLLVAQQPLHVAGQTVCSNVPPVW
jgi:hypothetical protein